MSASTVLLISTDPSLVESVTGVVRAIGDLRLRVHVLPGAPEAGAYLDRHEPCLVLFHLAEGRDAAQVSDLLRAIAAAGKSLATLVVSDSHQPAEAVALLRQGVADYLSRPLDLNRLAYLLDVLTVRARFAARAPEPVPPAVITLGEGQPFLYTPTAEMGAVMEQVRRVAPQNTTVLLGGETGTGKTSLARLIHELSPRRARPYSSLSMRLADSEPHRGSLSANLINVS
jgi:DNA-binding NtrC family response regulator